MEWPQGTDDQRAALAREFDDYWRRLIADAAARAEEVGLAAVVSSLKEAVLRSRDPGRITKIIEVLLQNMLFFLLDLPTTRKRAQKFARQWRIDSGKPYYPTIPYSSLNSSRAIRRTAESLQKTADKAAEFALTSWSDIASTAAQILLDLRLTDLREYEGERVTGVGPWGRCSMNFSSEALVSVDSTCSFLSEFGPDVIYWPPGLNISRCPFCDYEAWIDTPAMFYASSRRQVVYCLPARPGLNDEQAMEVYRPLISGIRERYAARLTRKQRFFFERAPEIIARNWSDFMYAAHMGEIVGEDRVYNLIALSDGSGFLFDFAKRFVRGLTRDEVAKFQNDLGVFETGPLSYSALQQGLEAMNQELLETLDDDFLRCQFEVISSLRDKIAVSGLAGMDTVGWRVIGRDRRH